MKKIAVVFISVLFTACATAPNKTVAVIEGNVTSRQFKIWGNCNMCKETIESSLVSDGIVKANWNKNTKQILVSYDSTKIDLPEIHHLIAMAGYDTDVERGSDSAYAELPDCCQYDRKP